MAKLSDWLRGLVGASKPRIEPFNYQGTRPASSQTKLKGGSKLYQEIQKRLEARTNDEAVQRASQGRIQQSRGTFNRYTAPELQSYITKMGMKGSPGSGLYGKELGRQADTEANIYSNVAGREEDRAENARRLGFGGQQTFVANEGNLKNTRATFDRAIDQASYNQANNARANTDLANAKAQQQLMSALAGGASMITSPTMASMPPAGPQQYLGGVGQFQPYGATQNQLPDAYKNYASRWGKRGAIT